MTIGALKKAMSDAKKSIKNANPKEVEGRVKPNEIDIPAAELITGRQSTRNEKIRKIPVREINPKLCRPWKYHNRDNLWLNQDKCSDLIVSIVNNGQMDPGLVREIDDPVYKYEIIYGVRRWFACSQIPNQKFLAKVTCATDKECMVLMHVENADSQDISEFERAYSFKLQFESGAFKNQTEMAKAFGITQSMISKSIRAASILDNKIIGELLINKLEIAIRDAYKLATLMSEPTSLKKIEEEGKKIAKEIQSGLNISTKQIFIRLIEAHKDEVNSEEGAKVLLKKKGVSLLEVKLDKKGNCSFVVSAGAMKGEKEKILESISLGLDRHLC